MFNLICILKLNKFLNTIYDINLYTESKNNKKMFK
ncbi:hypothetical protein LCGC14_0597490 [marine sediment metagenome]|uniref:Uncharacterized protein n=1 Tax=marine sediment metagenome TaxID=412755 RepID=A0A0F9RVC2_9ZZZZ